VSGLFLDYENEDFPTAILPNAQRRLNVTWDDILWSAVTVGRPDVFHVFRHQTASAFEAIFRWSMVRMALQQRGPGAWRVIRTNLFKQMDSWRRRPQGRTAEIGPGALCGCVLARTSRRRPKWKPQPNGKARLGCGNRALSSGKCDGGAANQIYQQCLQEK